MNIVWTVVTVLSLAVLTFTNPQEVLTVCLDSSAQALTTALGLCGVYCLWLGIFEVADKCKLVEGLSKCFSRLNRWLYGNIEKAASDYISLNLASNLLGVGNAATPSAIAAIKETERDEKLSRTGAMLFVVNATSVQLVPTTVIGLRASFASVSPADILLPNLLSTFITSVLGIALVFLFYGRAGKKKEQVEPLSCLGKDDTTLPLIQAKKTVRQTQSIKNKNNTESTQNGAMPR